jgi:hypothetical protein
VAFLILATTSIPYGAFLAVLVFGVVVGTFGHIIKSQTLIIAGILVIGLVSSYFTLEFVLQPTH